MQLQPLGHNKDKKMISQEIFDPTSTICAVSTPRGSGGIAVIRISGREAIGIAESIWHGRKLSEVGSHRAVHGEIIDPARPDEILDEAVATVFRGPHSFTGEDTVELSVHGSRWIQREVTALLIRQGCRAALAGEFTRRALLNGRLDLAQAEAVADVIASSSRAAHRLAASQLKGTFSRRIGSLRDNLLKLATLLELELDFSEEDVEFADRTHLRTLATEIATELSRLHNSYVSGAAIKEGIPVAIAGATNAGKSSLLNLLLSDDRAIVSDIHGTTRDTIEETLEIGDYLFRFIDTAGLRHTDDPIERLGIDRSLAAIDKARIILTVIDPAAPLPTELLTYIATRNEARVIYVINKIDINTHPIPSIPLPEGAEVIHMSAHTGQGLDTLMEALERNARADCPDSADSDTPIVTNARHAAALGEARDEALAIITTLDKNLPSELTASHLRQTISHLSAITGNIPTPEILQNIFQNFCIGK